MIVDRLRSLPGGEAAVIGSVEPIDLVALTRDAVDDLNATVLAEHPTRIQAPERLPAMSTRWVSARS